MKTTITTTNAAIAALTNSSARLDAIVNHVTNGAPLSDPGLVSETDTEPNPEITDDLATRVSQLQSQIDSFYSWAQSH